MEMARSRCSAALNIFSVARVPGAPAPLLDDVPRVLGGVALTSAEDAAVVDCGHREDISAARVLSNVPIAAVGVAITRAGKALLLFVGGRARYRVTILVMEGALRRGWTARTRFCLVRHLISRALAMRGLNRGQIVPAGSSSAVSWTVSTWQPSWVTLTFVATQVTYPGAWTSTR